MTREQYLFKMVMLGEGGVGKTSLIYQYMHSKFLDSMKATIGVDLFKKSINVTTSDNLPIRVALSVWDFSGQTEFQRVRPGFYKGARGAFLVFDLTNLESFIKIPQWHSECLNNVAGPAPLFLMVGNKVDLDNKRAITDEEIIESAEKLKIPYLLTSAKTGDNVNQAFYDMAIKLAN
ncbi:MAG: Rab family GTPase, partial [Promethearchaeota archaeon]